MCSPYPAAKQSVCLQNCGVLDAAKESDQLWSRSQISNASEKAEGASSLLTMVPDKQGRRAVLWHERSDMKLLLPFVHTHTVQYLYHHMLIFEALMAVAMRLVPD